MYDAVDDPYTYENSTVLINKLDLRYQAELDDFEAEISSARTDEPLPGGDLDFPHYCAVHRHLFQDVYGWAGTPRTVNEFAERAAHFLAELNAIHAFREGDGRAKLTFFALLAERAGHPLDFEKLDPDAMLKAMIASFDGDESRLKAVIGELAD